MGEILNGELSEDCLNDLLRKTAAFNILPVTTNCNVWCKFCSHRQNPPGVAAYRMHNITPDQVREALSFMDPGKPVVIGESATRLMEGEPFLHPGIRVILTLIRERMPRSVIRLTTNGNLIDINLAGFLRSLGRVEICLSLNSSNPAVRQSLMGDQDPLAAVRAPLLLYEAGVPFHGSVVAVPHLTGWDDLADTIRYLDKCGAVTTRVFLPGWTNRSPQPLRPPEDLWKELDSFISGMRGLTGIPLTLEPPLLKDLKAQVAGVMAGTPAAAAGVRAGDVIEKVDGRSVRTRVEAFYRVLNGANPHLELTGGQAGYQLQLKKKAKETSGLVMDYDIDPGTIAEVDRVVERYGAGSAELLASEMGYPVVSLALERFSRHAGMVRAVAVNNSFFGGNIGCAGLLTWGDLQAAMDRSPGTGLFVIPSLAFDSGGRDITGRSRPDSGRNPGILLEVI